MPPCFGALHCAVVQGFRLTLASRSWRQGGGAGVYSGSSPLWASADCPEFPEVTPPDARSYSALCLRSFPALSRLPSGQAQGVAAKDRHNSPRRQSRRLPPPPAGGQHILPIWTAYTPYMDITCHPHGQRMPLICLLYTAHVDSICLICGQRMLHIWTVYTLHMDSACRTQWTGFPAI